MTAGESKLLLQIGRDPFYGGVATNKDAEAQRDAIRYLLVRHIRSNGLTEAEIARKIESLDAK